MIKLVRNPDDRFSRDEASIIIFELSHLNSLIRCVKGTGEITIV